MPSLANTIGRFATADRDTRLQLLLDYSDRLPELPERLREARDRGIGRVHECQTPVFLWMERDGGRPVLYADVARESPTVRGFVGLLKRQVDGADPEAIAAIPDDLLDRLRLSEVLGMTRMQGLTAVLGRVKRMSRELAATE
jgi:cysteine desulfuration protein SufE